MPTRRAFNTGLLAMLGSTALAGCAATGSSDVSRGGPARITAIDTHAHVFERGLPLANARRYAPTYDAPLSAYLAQLDAHGVSHGVLIQPSFLGVDNSYLLAALKQAPQRLRGVAVIDPAAPETLLTQMNAEGIVGIRLNLIGAADPQLKSPVWQAALARLHALGWHVELHVEARRLPTLLQPLLEAQVNVVVDHFGRPDPALGVDDPGFAALLAAGRSRRVWVKISGAYRNGANGRGEAIAQAAMPRLKDALGLDRLVWGSDWPHTQFESQINYYKMWAFAGVLLPNAADRKQVLVDTPAQLFRLV
ncbi:amidohydrolase family protein [Ralstonia holmesii]|uniref:4-sulfomuconolactone hydrolase n=1 Tax=Ralstonia holmesii TaxID=3058602 RepID=A0ABC8Q6K9_9RALS|nr:amidohydrolase [Ralstonia sp. LMG 32967]CAJ0777635.1 4-sulfomuconolactone hydrolase [Ralstonia sp. LMG 32967]CAJ0821902.1 4-sulfomuconolactone hydrolase [Ralstonia sp. LMG 32967]